LSACLTSSLIWTRILSEKTKILKSFLADFDVELPVELLSLLQNLDKSQDPKVKGHDLPFGDVPS